MKDLIEKLNEYNPVNQEEIITKRRFLDFIEAHPDALLRSCLTGHITASGFVFNRNKGEILLIHHKKLNKWLQPGGHSDGEPDTQQTAIEEVFEETGILLEYDKGRKIFDLDIHTIPEHKGVLEHLHYDVRYLFEVDESAPLLQNHESNALAWIKLEQFEEYNNEDSTTMIVRKLND